MLYVLTDGYNPYLRIVKSVFHSYNIRKDTIVDEGVYCFYGRSVSISGRNKTTAPCSYCLFKIFAEVKSL